MAKRTIIAALIIIIMAAVIAVRITTRKSVTSQQKHSNVTLVTVGLPARHTINYTVDLTGDIAPIYETNIYSRVTGNLDEVNANIGDLVKENQMLALIDTTILYQILEQASATYDNAKITYERTKALAEKKYVAQSDLDSAEAALKVAQANYDIAKANFDYAHIAAPFTGYITRRLVDPGVLINANTTNLFTLVDTDTMKIYGNILEKNIPFVSVGSKGILKVDAYPDTQFTGTVIRMSGALDTTTRTMAVEIDVPNPKDLLKPGMFGYLTLILQEHPDAITIPAYSVLHDTSGYYVFVIQNGLAQRQNIQAGAQQDSITEVISGLGDTDSVVTAGQQFLRNGAPVRIQGAGQG